MRRGGAEPLPYGQVDSAAGDRKGRPYAEIKKCIQAGRRGRRPLRKTRAALGVGVLMLTGPLHESGDQQEKEACGLEDKAQDGGVDEQKGGADDDKA